MNKLTRGSICEFVGTFLFVFFGCASIVLAAGKLGGEAIAPGAGLVTVALAHGLVMAGLISGAMYLSGGQFNPAVSLGLVIAGKQSAGQALAFIAAQLLGAACAAGLLQLILTPEVANAPGVDLGATIGKLTRNQFFWGVFGIEAVATFALMLSVLAATVDERAHKLGGILIAATIAACILAFGPLTGASMNPARTFGPAICGAHWDMHWVYWAAPLAGAGLAAVIYREVWHEGKP